TSFEGFMKRMTYLMGLFLISAVYAQVYENTDVPCKPISEMMAHYGALAKAAQRADIFDYDVHYYNIELDINIDTEIVYGTVEVHLLSEVDNLENIQLDFVSGMTVDAVTLNGATFNHFSDLLSITLDGSYDTDEALVVGIEYHGHPEQTGFQAFAFGHQNGNPSLPPMISTLSEPYGARSWWPCKDVPSDKADSVRISLTTDSAYDAVSNGLLVSETQNLDGTKTTVWENKYPIAPYLVFLSISDYTTWTDIYHFADGDSMPLEYWMYPTSATTDMIDRWNRTSNMIEIFSGFYGEYPFADEKYGMNEFEWGGAMEHQTCSSMGSYGENTIAHELAHQWWGDLVTCSNFHHIWINEGFATYSEALYWGAVNGEDAYHAHMASKMNSVNSTVYRPDTSSVGAIFSTSMVYQKGAWVLHMLRHVVGDDIFFESLAAYRDEYQFRTASTEDFQAVVEEVWGQDLEWFFDQWIYGIGIPSYRWWWSAGEEDEFGNSQVRVHIDQMQSSSHPTYKMPIDLSFTDGANVYTTVIWDSLRVQEFDLVLDFVPTSLTFDEENWILKSANQVAAIDGGISPESFKLHSAYPNPFNGEVTIPYTTGAFFSGTLKIYDLRGSEVYSRALSHQNQAEYEVHWNGRNQQGISLGSGIYILQISSNGHGTLSQKISILK
ncbi:MAG: T9SS type A sorting domain-containing protein, partial [Candidatus Marinimicrobia bacterium]|nr:T9SS type A sorting domain-containing protein [Candidatus Neomarinimicrobiota bacterium]